MRRPEWQSHLVAAALSVGCGAAAPAGAVDTAPTAEAAELRSEREADAPRPEDDPGRERGDCAGAKASCEDSDAPEPEREREALRGPARARGRGDRVAKHARKGGKRSAPGQSGGGNSGAPAQSGGGNSGAPAQGGAGKSAPTGGELVDRLFFARGSADLALHGHALDAIAKVVRAGDPVTVIIVGGADEREPAALARTRARAVRDALRARGVPGSWIVLALDQPGPGPASYDQRVDVRMQEP